MDGLIIQLASRRAGAMITADAAAAATTIFIDRTTDFSDLGGSVLIENVLYSYSSVDRSATNPSITLTAGLTTSAVRGEYVDIEPISVQRWALIDSMSSPSDDAVWALVPHDLAGWLGPDGLRVGDGREQVSYEEKSGGFIVTDVMFKQNELGNDTVGAGSLSGNAVDADALAPDAVVGDNIKEGALDGLVITGALWRTRASGKRVEVTDPGLIQYDDDGVSVKTSIGDVNKFTGAFDAESMQIQDQLALRGVNNIFASGSVVTLQSNQTAPNQPASLLSTYDEVTGPGDYLTSPMGAHYDSTESNPSWASNFFQIGKHKRGSAYYNWPLITRPSGSQYSEWAPDHFTRIYYGGGDRAVTIFSHWDTVNTYPEGIYLYVHDDTVMTSGGTVQPSVVSGMKINNFSWFNEYALGRVFDTAGTANRDKFAYGFAVKNFDSTTWSLYGAIITPDGTGGFTTVHSASWASFPRLATDERLTGINYGSSQRMKFHGADQFVWVVSTNKWNYVYSLNGATRLTDLEFPVAINNAFRTFTIGDMVDGDFDGFRVMAQQSQDHRMIRYTDITWSGDGSFSDANAVWWVKYRWRNKLTEATMRETAHGPAQSVLMKKRSKLVVTSPSLPPPAAGVGAVRNAASDVWTFRHFVGRGTVEPGNGSMWLQSPLPGDLVTTISLSTTPLTSGTSLSSAFTAFAGATPATIRSSDLSHDSLPKVDIPGSGLVRFEQINERTLQKRVHATLSANQAIGGAGAFALVSNWTADTRFDTTRPGPNAIIPYSAGVWTIPSDGWWRIEFTGQFGAGAGGTFRIGAIFINGTEHRRFTVANGSFRSFHVWFEGNLTSSTTVDFRCVQDSGANIDLLRTINGSNERDTWCAIRRLSDRY